MCLCIKVIYVLYHLVLHLNALPFSSYSLPQPNLCRTNEFLTKTNKKVFPPLPNMGLFTHYFNSLAWVPCSQSYLTWCFGCFRIQTSCRHWSSCNPPDSPACSDAIQNESICIRCGKWLLWCSQELEKNVCWKAARVRFVPEQESRNFMFPIQRTRYHLAQKKVFVFSFFVLSNRESLNSCPSCQKIETEQVPMRMSYQITL